jgi:hypothetical protein
MSNIVKTLLVIEVKWKGFNVKKEFTIYKMGSKTLGLMGL